jgi:molecular chaperone DnaK
VIDARNQADSLAYSVEKTVNENRDRLPAVDVERVERAIEVVREAVKGDNLETIRTASADLQKASHSIAEQLYKQQGQGSAQGAGPKAAQDEVVDGEVVDA